MLSAGFGHENGTNKHTQSWIVHVVKFVFALGIAAVKIWHFVTVLESPKIST